MTPNSRSGINHFTQPDSIVPDQNNPQAWDRYAFAYNNPPRYTDPTGHDPLDWLSPFAYPTWGLGLKGLLKAVIGIDADLKVYANMGAVRDFVVEGDPSKLADFDVSLNLEFAVSGGASVEEAYGGIISGSEYSVEDQAGMDVIGGSDGVPVNVGGCLTPLLEVCGIASYTVNDYEHNPDEGVSEASYLVGTGAGGEASADIVQVSVPLVYWKPAEHLWRVLGIPTPE